MIQRQNFRNSELFFKVFFKGVGQTSIADIGQWRRLVTRADCLPLELNIITVKLFAQ